MPDSAAPARWPFLASKAVLSLIWIACVICFFLPIDHVAVEAARATAVVLLVVHVFETLLFLPTLRRAEGSLGMHLLQVLLFGVVHYGEVKSKLPTATPESEA